MTTTLQVKARQLQAAILFAADKDTRVQMRGVHIDPELGVMVATQGQVLYVSNQEAVQKADVGKFTLVIDDLKKVKFSKRDYDKVWVDVEVDFSAGIATIKTDSADFKVKLLDCDYVAWDRVYKQQVAFSEANAEKSVEKLCFVPEIIDLISKANKVLANKSSVYFAFRDGAITCVPGKNDAHIIFLQIAPRFVPDYEETIKAVEFE